VDNQYITCYRYTPDGRYSGQSKAFVDPQNPNRYVEPSNSTFLVPPPYRDGYVIVFNPHNKSWAYKRDYTGLVVYDKESGFPTKYNGHGELPDNLTERKPNPYIEFQIFKDGEWIYDINKKNRLIAKIQRKVFEQQCVTMCEPIEYQGYMFNMDLESRKIITDLAIICQDDVKYETTLYPTKDGELTQIRVNSCDIKKIHKLMSEQQLNAVSKSYSTTSSLLTLDMEELVQWLVIK
jgi:hypothetical protein